MTDYNEIETPHGRRWFRVVIGALTLVSLVTVLGLNGLSALRPPDQPYGPAGSRFFDKLALLRGDDAGGEHPGTVRKYTSPVAIELVGAPAERYRQKIGRIAATLSAWTGLSFALVPVGAIAGGQRIKVEILENQKMQDRYGAGGPICFSRTWGRGGQLRHSLIEVSERYTDCLAHEFMHAIGFDNHWTGPMAVAARPSVLAPRRDSARSDWFSAWDEMAIKLLYDWRMIPGTRRAFALPVAQSLLDRERDGDGQFSLRPPVTAGQ